VRAHRGFLHALRRLGRYGKAVSDHLLSVDRAAVSTAARRERLERRYRARVLRFALPRLLYVLSPLYQSAQEARAARHGRAAQRDPSRP
jgi:hypothetical protein